MVQLAKIVSDCLLLHGVSLSCHKFQTMCLGVDCSVYCQECIKESQRRYDIRAPLCVFLVIKIVVNVQIIWECAWAWNVKNDVKVHGCRTISEGEYGTIVI